MYGVWRQKKEKKEECTSKAMAEQSRDGVKRRKGQRDTHKDITEVPETRRSSSRGL